jgi:hypothetical protein
VRWGDLKVKEQLHPDKKIGSHRKNQRNQTTSSRFDTQTNKRSHKERQVKGKRGGRGGASQRARTKAWRNGAGSGERTHHGEDDYRWAPLKMNEVKADFPLFNANR